MLVATPTLEMGIDIGDLSTVMLASLPDSVAKYQQRVGRGGRLTGSSLSLTYVTGRGDNLPRLGEPLSMINGAVRPPATYLDAEEILQRQFIASVIDTMVREGYASVPRTSGEVLASADPGSLLGDVIVRVRDDGQRLVDAFLAGFADTTSPGIAALTDWVLGAAPLESGIGHSAEATICHAVGEHTREVEQLRRRRREIEDSIPALREQAERTAATDEDKRALRSAVAGTKLMRKVIDQLTGDTWIAGLELRGLLPNYSLIDDSVQLDAQVSWIDPETQQFDSEPMVVDRGSARALTELAPGRLLLRPPPGDARRRGGTRRGQRGRTHARRVRHVRVRRSARLAGRPVAAGLPSMRERRDRRDGPALRGRPAHAASSPTSAATTPTIGDDRRRPQAHPLRGRHRRRLRPGAGSSTSGRWSPSALGVAHYRRLHRAVVQHRPAGLEPRDHAAGPART